MNNQPEINKKQKAIIQKMKNPVFLFFFLLFKLPSACIAGIKVKSLNEKKSEINIPFKFTNKNPFKSIYFAIQSMGAEFSTAALAVVAMSKYTNSIAYIVVNLNAEFLKKANSKVTFTCEDGLLFEQGIKKCIAENKPIEITAKTIGRMEDGTVVSIFNFTWSFKVRN